jgi:hypothetical protein
LFIRVDVQLFSFPHQEAKRFNLHLRLFLLDPWIPLQVHLTHSLYESSLKSSRINSELQRKPRCLQVNLQTTCITYNILSSILPMKVLHRLWGTTQMHLFDETVPDSLTRDFHAEFPYREKHLSWTHFSSLGKVREQQVLSYNHTNNL